MVRLCSPLSLSKAEGRVEGLGIIRSRGILSLPKDSPLEGEANSFDKLTTPSANDAELAEGHPERAKAFDAFTSFTCSGRVLSNAEGRSESYSFSLLMLEETSTVLTSSKNYFKVSEYERSRDCVREFHGRKPVDESTVQRSKIEKQNKQGATSVRAWGSSFRYTNGISSQK